MYWDKFLHGIYDFKRNFEKSTHLRKEMTNSGFLNYTGN